MTTIQKVLIGAGAAAVIVGGIAIGLTVSRTPDKIDLSTIHTEAPEETMTQTEAPSSSVPAETMESSEENDSSAVSVSASIETYASGKISIQYPVVSNLEDTKLQEQINAHLKENALSVIEANDLDEENDSLEIQCSVISADRSRLTATYSGTLSVQGAAHPVNLFYSNTVSMTQGTDLGFSDFTDAYTMAGYVLSDDVKFLNLTADALSAVLEYRQGLTLEELTSIFEGADFPLNEDGTWPESFSYEKQGAICFSMPVPHALGDYVIVSFDPVTK